MSTFKLLLALLWKELALRRRSPSAIVLDLVVPVVKVIFLYLFMVLLHQGGKGVSLKAKSVLEATQSVYLYTPDRNLEEHLKESHTFELNECTHILDKSLTDSTVQLKGIVRIFESEQAMLDNLTDEAYEYYVEFWWRHKMIQTARLGIAITFEDDDGNTVNTYGGEEKAKVTYYVSAQEPDIKVQSDLLLLLHMYQKTIWESQQNIGVDWKVTQSIEKPFDEYKTFIFMNAGTMWLLLMFTCVIIYPLCYLIDAIIVEKQTDMKQLLQMSGVSSFAYYFSYILVDLPLVLLFALFSAYPIASDLMNTFHVLLILLPCCISTVFFTVAYTVFFKNVILALLTFIMAHVGLVSAVFISLFVRGGIYKVPFWVPFFFFPPLGTLLTFEKAHLTLYQPEGNFLMFTALTLVPLISCAFWTFVILYVGEVWPLQKATPKPLLFPIMALLEKRKPKISLSSHQPKDETRFEEDPKNLDAGLRVENVRKRFGLGPEILKGVNFEVYMGQITVLLGHNGAGKTTLISIITGIYGATSGRICLGGIYTDTEPAKARKKVGLCPQENILYDNLTVGEHLTLFAKLKNFPGGQLHHEITRVLNLINLPQAQNTKAKNLSGGMKRRLQLGLAFVGGSKILILDEPSSGLDIEARRGIWDMLLAVKRDYLIFMTTHHMEEADCLGDRIAIMHAGDIKCCGSSMFLKRVLGTGYSLRILKLEKANNEKIQTFVVSQFRTARLVKESKVELLYSFAKEESKNLPQYFRALDAQKDSLGIVSTGVEPTTLDDVFVKFESTVSHLTTRSGVKSQFDIVKPVLKRTFCKKFKAIFLKRVLMALRSKATYYSVASLLIMFWGMTIAFHFIPAYRWTKLIDSMNIMSEFVAILNDPEDVKQLSDYLPDHINETAIVDSNSITIRRINSINSNRITYCVLASFHPDHLDAGTRTVVYLMNAFMTKNRAEQIELEAQLYPKNLPIQLTVFKRIRIYLPYIGLLLFIPLLYLPMKGILAEKSNKARFLQMMTGVHFLTYWFTNACFDFALWFSTALLALTSISIYTLAFQAQTVYLTPLFTACLIICLALQILYCILLAYVASLVVEKPPLALITLVTVFLVVPVIALVPLPLFENIRFIALAFASSQYSAIGGHLVKYSDTQFICNDLLKSRSDLCDYIIETFPNYTDILYDCCQSHSTTFFAMMKDGGKTGDHTMPFALIGYSASMCILFIAIIGSVECFLILLPRRSKFLKSTLGNEDDDVQKERERTELVVSQNQQSQYALVVQGLSKKFGIKQAVKRLTFIVGKSECFGLLGVNGAGKTTAFKMLVGEITPTAGQGFILGHSIINNLDKARVNIGYCPQFNAFTPGITGREILYLYGRLRGVKNNELKKTVNQIISLVDLEAYADRKADNYSGGNKRKLSIGMALIGFPPILFLDEPTVAIDPVARRKIWSIIEYAREVVGSAIVLTSHAMDECESLCENIGIMVDGEFRCLGSLQHLKNKFGQGITITMKIKPNKDILESVKNSVASLLPQAVLVDSHTNLVTYQIREKNINLGVLYETMENIKTGHDLEDYHITETSLEQIFLGMARASSTPVSQMSNPLTLQDNVQFRVH